MCAPLISIRGSGGLNGGKCRCLWRALTVMAHVTATGAGTEYFATGGAMATLARKWIQSSLGNGR